MVKRICYSLFYAFILAIFVFWGFFMFFGLGLLWEEKMLQIIFCGGMVAERIFNWLMEEKK